MMRISILLLTYLLLITATHIQGMEVPIQFDFQTLFNLSHDEKKALLLNIAAYCEHKNTLRKTCRYLNTLASRKNEKLLVHPLLRLSEEDLNQFAFYHGQLGDTEIFLNLLQKGFDPNKQDNHERTVLHYAAQYSYIDIVDALLKHPKLDRIIIGQQTATRKIPSLPQFAIKYDQDLVLKNILSACKPTFTIPYEGFIDYAIESDALRVVKMLIADPNATSVNTAAAQKFVSEVTKNLDALEHKLRVSPVFSKKELEKLIFYYGTLGNSAMVHELLSQQFWAKIGNPSQEASSVSHMTKSPMRECRTVNGEKMLCIAATRGLVNAVRTLLDCGIDPNSCNDGISALHSAISNNHLPIIKMLISQGALVSNTCINDLFGTVSALHLAANSDNTYITQLLIDSGADVNIQIDTGDTPLHCAVRNDCPSIVTVLIDRGADVNAQDNNQGTPLFWTINRRVKTAHALLRSPDINVNAKNAQGNTLLHCIIAYYHSNKDLVDALLARTDILINIKNNEGKTPLDIISTNERLRDLLISRGAKTYKQLFYEAMKDECIIQ